MLPDEAKRQVQEDFGDSILRDIAKIIGSAYPRTSRSAYDRYSASVAHDFYPIERRAMIENSLPMLRSRHPHVQVIPAMNKKRTSSFYQVANGRSVLTQSKTEGRGELPRDADFRRTLAQSPQMVFETYRDLVPSLAVDANAVYGIVAHGPADNDSKQVGFIEILIPDTAGNVIATIDLTHLWSADLGPVVIPTQPITPVAPTLKVVPRKIGEGTGA